jgi:hypothetical protein
MLIARVDRDLRRFEQRGVARIQAPASTLSMTPLVPICSNILLPAPRRPIDGGTRVRAAVGNRDILG